MTTITPVFLPVERKLTQPEQRKRADEFRAQLLALLAASDGMGSRELVEATGRAINTVREYMNKLVRAGLVNSELIPNPINGGATVMAIYTINDGEDIAPKPGDVQHRPTLTRYPLHHVRDPMVAALFGAR